MRKSTFVTELRDLLDAGVHEHTPVIFEVGSPRPWESSSFIFNPKRIDQEDDRLIIRMKNGHCVTKTLPLIISLLDTFKGDLPIDVQISDKDHSVKTEIEPAMEIHYDANAMAVFVYLKINW